MRKRSPAGVHLHARASSRPCDKSYLPALFLCFSLVNQDSLLSRVSLVENVVSYHVLRPYVCLSIYHYKVIRGNYLA